MANSVAEIYNMNQGSSGTEIDISQPIDFNIFVSRSTIYFWDLKEDKVHSHKAERFVSEKEYEKHREHLKHLHKDIFPSPQKDHRSLNSSFSDTIQFYKTTQRKKKLYCRLGDSYLVKKCFTEGVQYVKEGEVHKYKVIGRALDIYTTNSSLELKNLRSIYDTLPQMERNRILNGGTKVIHPNTYYIVLAPCHTFFRKWKLNTREVENNTAILSEADLQITNVAEDRNGFTSSERSEQTEEFPMLPGSSESRDNVYGTSRNSIEIEGGNEPEIINGRSYESDRPFKRVRSSTPLPRPSTSQMEENTSESPSPNYLLGEREFEAVNEPGMVDDSARQSKRMKYSTPLQRPSNPQVAMALVPPSPNTLRDDLERIADSREKNGASIRAVFAVRKDSDIESYTLRSGSTFQVLQDNIMTGSFTIENDDMDPNVFEYHGGVQYIREVARFKNGSVFETTLTVQKDLLNELRDPLKKREKVVVNYFFEFAFKAVESAYKKFCEMRNTKMIGSCVPAIVPMSNARFCGAVPDTYEAKPY